MKNLSIIILARDEEKNLPELLAGIKDLAGEVVVADTGSQDRTREIAAQAGARVVDLPWEDDFAAARNRAAEAAAGEWILWIDADERLHPGDVGALREALRAPGPKEAFAVEMVSLSRDSRPSSFLQVRLFPRAGGLRFEGKVNESVVFDAARSGCTVRFTGIRLFHHGFETFALREGKFKRNLSILEKALAKGPENPLDRFHHARTLLFFRRRDEAAVQLERIAETPAAGSRFPEIHTRSMALLAGIHSDAGRFSQAEQWARKAVAADGEDMAARAALARALLQRGNGQEAFTEASRALDLKPSFSSIGVDYLETRTYLYGLLIQVLFTLQKHVEAAALVQKGLAELPMSAEMADIAASYYLRLDRYEDAAAVFSHASARIPDHSDHFEKKRRALAVLKDVRKESAALHPDYLKMAPPGAESVLVVGVGSGVVGLELKKMGVRRTAGLCLPGEDPENAAVRFDAVYESQEALIKGGEEFDLALFGDQLVRLKYPGETLAAVRRCLKERGSAVFIVPNAMNYTVFSALGYGLFSYGDTGILRTGTRRLLARAGAVRLLEQHGFITERIQECLDPLFNEQIANAPGRAVNLGKALLDLEGLDKTGMKEFFVIQYFIQARGKPVPGGAEGLLDGLRKKAAPGRAADFNNRGNALLAEHKWSEAAECFHQALALEQDNHEAYCNLGLTEWYQSNFEDAYFLFKRSVGLCPGFEDGLLNLWDAAQKTGRAAEAREILADSLNRFPGMAEVRRVLSETHVGDGEIKLP